MFRAEKISKNEKENREGKKRQEERRFVRYEDVREGDIL